MFKPFEAKTRTYHGRVGAAHGGWRVWGEDGQDGMPTGRFEQKTAVPLTPQTIEEYTPGRDSGSTDQRIPM